MRFVYNLIKPIALILVVFCSTVESSELITSVVELKKLPLDRWFDGTVEAAKQATVSAETKGRVTEILFDIGDYVTAGSVIIKLVSNEQREVLNQAEAKLSETRATYENEVKDFDRIEKLYQSNIASKSEWDRALAKLNISKAQVVSSDAALKSAKEQLSYAQINAPYSGVVSARHVEVGEAVFPGKTLMSGFDPNYLRVWVDLPADIAAKVKMLKAAKVVLADGTFLRPSKILVYPVADPSTSTVRVRLELPEKSTLLYPGQFVKVAFTTGDINRLLIPVQAVVYRSEVSGVYVVKDGVPSLRQIRLGRRFDEQIEVLAGLSEGEKVALDPVDAAIAMAANQKEHVGD